MKSITQLAIIFALIHGISACRPPKSSKYEPNSGKPGKPAIGDPDDPKDNDSKPGDSDNGDDDTVNGEILPPVTGGADLNLTRQTLSKIMQAAGGAEDEKCKGKTTKKQIPS